MTDRELLEKAAKAAGMKASDEDGVIYAGFGSREWNPLTDDGDALRLAVKLRLCIEIYGYTAKASRGTLLEAIELFGAGDPHEATRRAIVRAAAALVEKM